MTDIAERLRRTARLGIIDGGLMEEAADEIERLKSTTRNWLDEAIDTPEGQSFLASMELVKRGETNPGQHNRAGCVFPHCACNKPWERCDR